VEAITKDWSLPERLKQRLSAPLPGRVAQSEFEPELSFGRHYATPPTTARPAAVLALLYWHAEQWHLPLTVRPATMVDHAGQVSFPGGALEADESSEAAALRELEEELGVGPDQVTVLGSLSPLYLFVTDFAVQPYVAFSHQRPDFVPCAREVASVMEVPVAYLLDRENRDHKVRRHGRLEFAVPHIPWREQSIWGATSMMLGELLAVLEDLEQFSTGCSGLDRHSADE